MNVACQENVERLRRESLTQLDARRGARFENNATTSLDRLTHFILFASFLP